VRQFAATGFRIWNLSREAKLVYTFFGLFSLAALGSSALFYEDLVGVGGAGVRAYYAGEGRGANARTARAPVGGGPEIALPDEAGEPGPARPLTVTVSYRKLLEVTHFHLFTVPVFLLIVSHLFMLTGLSPTAKALWIVLGWLGAALHLAAPWAVHYGGGAWAPLYAVSGALLGAGSLVLTVYPTWAMWLGRPPARGRPASDEAAAD
jgi:hypothetical protein